MGRSAAIRLVGLIVRQPGDLLSRTHAEITCRFDGLRLRQRASGCIDVLANTPASPSFAVLSSPRQIANFFPREPLPARHPAGRRPMALRPRLATGLPLSVAPWARDLNRSGEKGRKRGGENALHSMNRSRLLDKQVKSRTDQKILAQDASVTVAAGKVIQAALFSPLRATAWRSG